MSYNIYYDNDKDRVEVIESGDAPVPHNELEQCDYCGSTEWERSPDESIPLIMYECAECGKDETGVE